MRLPSTPPAAEGQPDLPRDRTLDSSFQQFYAYAYAFPRIAAQARLRGASQHDAGDVTQQVMLGAYRRWNKPAANGRRLCDLVQDEQLAYVLRSLTYAMRDAGRRQQRVRALLSRLWHHGHSDYVTWDESADGTGGPALAELRRLPRRQREVLALMIEDWSTEEIADHLGISASSVRTHLQKARKTLREHLTMQKEGSREE